MTENDTADPSVAIIGGGPAGLTAGLFTARAGLETAVFDVDGPILERNAHLENFPGFPAGVNSRLLLDMLRDQAEHNGVDHRGRTRVTRVERSGEGLGLTLNGSESHPVDYIVCTSWAETDYLASLDGVGIIQRGSKTYVDVEDDGSTGVPGLYAAGRIAGTHHQAIVAAGDGAAVALAVIEASAVPFYHDWVAPDGYFTGRGREVPPGCEEIDAAEREARERESMATMRDYFAEPHAETPTPHPSMSEE